VHSLAGEQLQESESFVGSERQKREEVVRVAMGSVYQGKRFLFMIPVPGTYKISLILFSAGSDTVRFSRQSRMLLTDSDIRDCIGDVLPLSGPSPLPASAKTSAGRT
jgi:hypothetical protein